MPKASPFTLIADSGSTKTDWVLLNDGAVSARFSTIGFNPQFHNEAFILQALNSNKGLLRISTAIRKVYFFGAGCSSPARNKVIRDALAPFFTTAVIKVDHDVKASALATCGRSPGISCILGTGSNSTYYDGKRTYPNNFGLGFIIGDEGSGSYYGKLLIRSYLYGMLPAYLVKRFDQRYKMDKEIMLRHVYNNKGANVWLASFSRFMSDNKTHPWVKDAVGKGMREFMLCCVCTYPRYKKLPVHFTGSIAWHFSAILHEVAQSLDIRVGKVIQQPIDGLAEYFLNQ